MVWTKEKQKIYFKNWEKAHRKQRNEYSKLRARELRKNPEYVKKEKERSLKYYYEHKTNSKYLKLRFELLKEANFTCQYCGRKAPDVPLQVDHIFPKSKGGKNNKSNYRIACKDCNLGKGDSLL